MRLLRRQAFTLIEILIAVVVVAILATLAGLTYYKFTTKARATEAVTQLENIRTAQFAHRATYGDFVEAADSPSLNDSLDLQVTSRNFDYRVEQAAPSEFLAIATQKLPAGSSTEPLVITMSNAGQLTYNWPGGSSSGGFSSATSSAGSGSSSRNGGGGTSSSGGGGGGGSGGFGGGSGGGGGGGGGSPSAGSVGGTGPTTGGGGGSSSGGGDSSSGGGSSSGGDAGSGGGGDSGGSGGSTGGTGGTGGGGGGTDFNYIVRAGDIWSGWPDENQLNIEGIDGPQLLADAYNVIVNSGASAIANDIFRRSISMSFLDSSSFSAICGSSAIACFDPCPARPFCAYPPGEPIPPPIMYFNPDTLGEDPETLATVIVHEGTHFQEYLDGRIFDDTLGTVDIEFDAFWNESVFWGEIRAGREPFDSPLEQEAEFIYQKALLGESELRDIISIVYCGGLPNC